jgi:glucose-6-phosphate-specific signal transduction histidine kinase
MPLTGKQCALIAAVCLAIVFLVSLATLSSGEGFAGAMFLFFTASCLVSTPLFCLISAVWMTIKAFSKSSNSDA